MSSIRLAGILDNSLVNGEGMRAVIFSQGCTHNCKDCFNPHTHSFTGGELIDIDKLVTRIKSNPIIHGVTFSGGDPMQQADKFVELARKLNNQFNIWCFTGYTYEEILSSKDKNRLDLLYEIDVLVDGEFKKELSGGLKYRGSSNQRIIDVKKSLKYKKLILLPIK